MCLGQLSACQKFHFLLDFRFRESFYWYLITNMITLKELRKKQLLWIITGVLSCTDEQYLPTETETNK